MTMALCSNPRTRQSWLAIRAQASALGQARSAYLPKINAWARVSSDASSTSGNSTERQGASASVSVAWRIWDFGVREEAVEAAQALVTAALASHDAALQETMSLTIQSFFDTQAARATRAGRARSEAIARGTFEAAQRREASGMGSGSETLQAKTAMLRARLELANAEGAFKLARISLANAVGIRADNYFDLAEIELPDIPQLERTLATWLDQAEASHPALAAARAQLSAVKAQAKKVSKEGMPTLEASAAYYRNGRPDQGLSGVPTREQQVGVILNVPLFDGFERLYRERAAQVQVEDREAELNGVSLRVSLEVAQAHASAVTAIAALEVSQALVETARASNSSSRRRYDRGAADMLEVLSTQQALTDAELLHAQARAKLYSSRLRVLAALGQLRTSEILHPDRLSQ
nr:TolC family protein [uncultured Pseudacidovorax sp.]